MARELTRGEVVAMWLWGAEYAKSGLGAIEWFRRLSASRRDTVLRFLRQYEHSRQLEFGPTLAAIQKRRAAAKKGRTALRRRRSPNGGGK